MRSYWATVVATLVGVTGGVLGAGFGLVIGLLVDLVLADLRVQSGTRRFLDTGDAPSWLSVELPLAGLVVGAVVPSGVITERLIAAVERRLADARPDRFAARLCERSIATAAGGSSLATAGERLSDSLPDQKRRVARVVWEALRDEHAPPLAFERLVSLAGTAGIDHGFVTRELPVHTFLDERACAVLGVGSDATVDEVRHAYRLLAAQFHPDTAGELSDAQREASTEAFVRIRAAYETLLEDLAGRGER